MLSLVIIMKIINDMMTRQYVKPEVDEECELLQGTEILLDRALRDSPGRLLR